MAGVFLHFEQLFVRHAINVRTIRVLCPLILATSRHGHSDQSFLFLLSLVHPSLHHRLHHESLLSPFPASLDFFDLHGHLELMFVVFGFGAFSADEAGNNGFTGFFGGRTAPYGITFIRIFFLFAGVCFAVEGLFFQFHDFVLEVEILLFQLDYVFPLLLYLHILGFE